MKKIILITFFFFIQISNVLSSETKLKEAINISGTTHLIISKLDVLENINLFNVSRKNDFNFAAAVSDTEGEADLYFYHKKSALNTINKQIAHFQKAKVSSIRKIKTKTICSRC